MEKADRRSSVGLFLHIGQKMAKRGSPGGAKRANEMGDCVGMGDREQSG